MTTEILSFISIAIGLIAVLLLLKKGSAGNAQADSQRIEAALERIEKGLKEDFRINREETQNLSKENRAELNQTLKDFQKDLNETLRIFKEENQKMSKELLETIKTEFKEFRVGFEANFKDFTDHQRIKFDDLVKNTDKRLEDMRVTVDEKLQKTLSERLGQSFEAVGNQLKAVQEGLGEMRNLAQDVGGLKKVLSNVKQRGGLGEVQLEMLLEQILAPEQYEANAKTKQGSNDLVEFAIKLPGRDDNQSNVYLPIDAKFPKDAYEQLEKMISQVMNIDHYFVFVAVSPLLGFLYNLIEGFAGASPGKMILGLKIANQDGSEADIKTYMIRWALKNSSGILSFLTILTSITFFNTIGSSFGFAFFVGCFFILCENKQGFHDMISKTAVYRNRDII